MKRLIFSLLFAVTLLQAQGEHLRLPYDTTMKLLKTIKSEAIVLGTGKTEVYAFIDPLCPHSRKFITMVSGNEKMLSKYKYYLFLYTIPRLKSQTVVRQIYASKNRAETLLDVMVYGASPDKVPTGEAEEKTVADIAAVAKKLDVYKRPYVIVATSN